MGAPWHAKCNLPVVPADRCRNTATAESGKLSSVLLNPHESGITTDHAPPDSEAKTGQSPVDGHSQVRSLGTRRKRTFTQEADGKESCK